MDRMSPLSIIYLRADQLGRRSAAWREHALACVTFAADPPCDAVAGLPVVRVQTPMVGQTQGVLEVWRSAPAVVSGQSGTVHYRCNGELMFGQVVLSESDFPETADGAGPSSLQRATKSAFQEIFALLDKTNYSHLLRVWNYFPAINEESHGLERYRQFNIGRQEGFLACSRSLTENIPAACALGTIDSQLTVLFIAGQSGPVAIENPRQVSAYHYPPDYGPRSPTFSRATLARVGEQEMLFISGTSSIVGHRSVHIGDVEAQTRETLANIKAVVGAANRFTSHARYSEENMMYKVYVRRAKDVDAVRAEMQRAYGPKVQVIFLEAEICRRDLLVEIEAIAGIPLESP